jgi:hypothetical protein
MSHSPLEKTDPSNPILNWLAAILLPRKEFVLVLGQEAKTDIYCNQGCYTEQSSVVLSSETLMIFTELGMILQVSLIFLPPEPAQNGEFQDAVRRIAEIVRRAVTPGCFLLWNSERLSLTWKAQASVASGTFGFTCAIGGFKEIRK